MGSPTQLLGQLGVHPHRKEIARYLLSRGLDDQTLAPSTALLDWAAAARTDIGPRRTTRSANGGTRASRRSAANPLRRITFPDGLTPVLIPTASNHDPASPLPQADVVVITWTVDELAGLAKVFCPGHSASKWAHYTHNYESFAPAIRSGAPAATSKRLGSFQLVTVAGMRVLCMKSELHLNQDGIHTGDGTATLPVKDLFRQIIDEARPAYVFTVGTAGSVFDGFQLGDVVVTRAAKFRLQDEFRNEPFNGVTYRSDWRIPTVHFESAQTLMNQFASQLVEPPFAPPTTAFPFAGPPILPSPANTPDIKLEQDSRDMPEFHPILTTDYFEYGTTVNRLDREGAAVEMGDAVLGLAVAEADQPPRWAVVRNMSDPVINGELPAKQYKLNEQTTWAVGYYTAYGEWTSVMSALATWGIIAGLS